MARHLRGPWSPLLLLVCANAVAVTACALFPSDYERYWLAFAGNWTLAHGRILETLQGSWTPDRAWVDQEWLVAVATAWTQAHGVYVLLELLFAASIVFGVAFVAYESVRTRTHPLIACAQVAVAALGAIFFAQARAQALVWALLPATMLIWRRAPWGAVPLMAAWANLHGSFPVGILWMLLHLDRRRVAPFAVATLATLANPVGWRLWEFTIELSRNARLSEYVNEWSPALVSYTGVVVALLALAPLWMRLAAGIRARRPIRYGNLAFVAAAALGTVVAIRYSMLLFLTIATAIGESFRTTAKPMPLATRFAAVAFSLMTLVLGGRLLFAGGRADFAACAPLVRGQRVFVDEFQNGSLVELAGGYANLDGRIDAFPLSAIRDSSIVLREPRRAEAVVDRSGAQMLALGGSFVPRAPWHRVRTCGGVTLYGRS